MRYIKMNHLSQGQLVRATAKCDESVSKFLIIVDIDDWKTKFYDQLTQKYYECSSSQVLLALNKSGNLMLDSEEPVWMECTLDLEEMNTDAVA